MEHDSLLDADAVPPCPLCGDCEPDPFHTSAKGRRYFRSRECELVYLHQGQRLSPADERARYELHENDGGDPRYVDFLRRLADPVAKRLRAGATGLDYGSGPAPVMASLLMGAGFPCESYDPFFHPDGSLLERRYDYVTCCEVVEHVYDAAGLFATFTELLAPGGLLGVMTRFRPDQTAFGAWWYARDPTHVCFYSPATMRWIAWRYGWAMASPHPDVTLFTC